MTLLQRSPEGDQANILERLLASPQAAALVAEHDRAAAASRRRLQAALADLEDEFAPEIAGLNAAVDVAEADHLEAQRRVERFALVVDDARRARAQASNVHDARRSRLEATLREHVDPRIETALRRAEQELDRTRAIAIEVRDHVHDDNPYGGRQARSVTSNAPAVRRRNETLTTARDAIRALDAEALDPDAVEARLERIWATVPPLSSCYSTETADSWWVPVR